MFEAKVYLGEIKGIDPEMIEKASKYPMSKLIKNKHGMAICPFHNDKTPSLDVRKNFYFCYGCGATGNAIHYVRKIKGLTFAEAIKQLV